MHGTNNAEAAQPEKGLGQSLQQDLKDCIDWQWLKVSSDIT